MMRALIGALGLLALPLGLLGQTQPAQPAQPAQPMAVLKPAEQRDSFFKDGKVVEFKIDLTKEATESLRREPRKYVKATLTEGSLQFKDVGMHLKGAAGSSRPIDDKPGITLNMDKFADDQLYRGMDKFHLANSVQDPSYLSELICGELLRAAGVPASRIGHAVVTINGKVRGLYYVKEGYDRAFLQKNFGNGDGNFYDGGFLRDIDQPLELVHTKKDVADRGDLKALVTACREANKEKRFQQLEKLLELDKFISYMVLEAIMWDWDGYPFKCNNYRVYHEPTKDKITFIPSGMDQMFGDVNGPVMPDFGGMVARGLMETPEGKKRYIARMAEIMKTVYKTDTIVKRIDELEKTLQPILAKIDAGAGADYKNQAARLRDAVKQREKVVNQQLKTLLK